MVFLNVPSQQLPRRKQQITQERSKVLRETEQDPFEDAADEEEEEVEEPHSSSSRPIPNFTPQSQLKADPPVSASFDNPTSVSKKYKKDKKSSKKKPRPFNLEAEKGKMKTVIAESSIASTNLLNALQSINREHERVSDNASTVKMFDTCKMLRRHILRYVSAV